MRRMEVEEHDLLSVRFAHKQFIEGPHGRVDTCDVVAVVVVRTPVLPLVAILHAVLVHERHEHAVGVVAHPLALRRAGEDFVDDSLHDRIRRRLAGVVTGCIRKQPLRSSFPARNAKQLRVAAAALRFAENVELHAFLPAPACARRIPVLLQIWNRRREARLVLVGREGVVKGVVRLVALAVRIQPAPGLPAVAADRRAERRKIVVLREVEMEFSSGCTAKREIPVEPISLRVAKVGTNGNDAICLVDFVDLDVPSGIFTVYRHLAKCNRCRKHTDHQTCNSLHHSPFISLHETSHLTRTTVPHML